MLPETFRCYLVTKDAAERVTAEMTRRPIDELPAGDVTLRVAYSSLNYKDALAVTGHPGVSKVFPHVPGVDAAGTVVASEAAQFRPGDRVLVTGFDMGASRWGGYAEYVRVPWEWIVPLPAGLTLRESMMLGTAGFTAGLCVDALHKHGVSPDRGEVIVTGASGGVGGMAVSILAGLGYQVAAVSGKPPRSRVFAKPGSKPNPRPRAGRRSKRPTALVGPLGGRRGHRRRQHPLDHPPQHSPQRLRGRLRAGCQQRTADYGLSFYSPRGDAGGHRCSLGLHPAAS